MQHHTTDDGEKEAPEEKRRVPGSRENRAGVKNIAEAATLLVSKQVIYLVQSGLVCTH